MLGSSRAAFVVLRGSSCGCSARAARERTDASARGGSATSEAAPVAAGRLDVALGLSAGGTSWSTDPLGYGSLELGVRLLRIVTPYVGGALGYARVDQRLLTRITVGVSVGALVGERFRGCSQRLCTSTRSLSPRSRKNPSARCSGSALEFVIERECTRGSGSMCVFKRPDGSFLWGPKRAFSTSRTRADRAD